MLISNTDLPGDFCQLTYTKQMDYKFLFSLLIFQRLHFFPAMLLKKMFVFPFCHDEIFCFPLGVSRMHALAAFLHFLLEPLNIFPVSPSKWACTLFFFLLCREDKRPSNCWKHSPFLFLKLNVVELASHSSELLSPAQTRDLPHFRPLFS